MGNSVRAKLNYNLRNRQDGLPLRPFSVAVMTARALSCAELPVLRPSDDGSIKTLPAVTAALPPLPGSVCCL